MVSIGKRCNQHKKLFGWHLYEQQQGNRHSRGYGYKWEKLRVRVLKRDNYLCVICSSHDVMTPAKQVDHIIPKSQQGTDNINNLQSLCVACHQEKTAKESR